MKINDTQILSQDLCMDLKAYPQFITLDESEYGNYKCKPIDKDCKNWLTFDSAKNTSSNLGFVLTESDPFVCIALSDVLENGGLYIWAYQLIHALPSTYIELDCSNNGLYIIYKLNEEPELCSSGMPYPYNGSLDIYWSDDYFPYSSNVFNNCPIATLDAAVLVQILDYHMDIWDSSEYGFLARMQEGKLEAAEAIDELSTNNAASPDTLNQK